MGRRRGDGKKAGRDMQSVRSVDGVPIRLTEERWFHIVENHDDMAGHHDDVLETVADPDLVLPGIAAR